MKILFNKDDDSNISVMQKVGKEEVEFSYVEMIKHLINTKELKSPIVKGDFSDAEKASIDSMAKHINEELQALDEEREDE